MKVYQIIHSDGQFVPHLIHAVQAGVEDAEWGNEKALLAYWIGEQENSPARVSLLSIQNGMVRQLKSKTLFMVRSCSFCWHPQDMFLALLVDRWNKTKRTSSVNFEIFRLQERDIPVDNVECPQGQSLIHFAWEPSVHKPSKQSHKFATIVRDDASGTCHLVFWEDKKDPKQPVRQFTAVARFEHKFIDRIYWSPKGTFLLACNITTNSNGNFELWDSSEMCLVASMEHEQLSQVQWSFNGLQFCSYCSFNDHPGAENGYLLWDLCGEQQVKKSVEKFQSFHYRPIKFTLLSASGAPLLSPDDYKRIFAGLPDAFAQFEREDLLKASATQQSTIAHRQSVLAAWNEWKQQCHQRYESMNDTRRLLKGTTASSEDTVQVEEVVEEVIDEQQIFSK